MKTSDNIFFPKLRFNTLWYPLGTLLQLEVFFYGGEENLA